MLISRLYKLFFLLLFLLGGIIANAQLSPQEISIPMRDGKTLSAHLYLPNNTSTFSTILVQTPYNKETYKTVGLPLGVRQNLSSSNYAFVILDWRCFFGSANACTGNVDRGNDGYDAVEWIAAQSWSDGKIATWGPSALGNVQFNTAFKKPPHLVCAIPEVASPQTSYDNYYDGGVLTTGRIKTLNVLYGGVFNTVIDNPYYNNIWQYVESNNFDIDQISIPMLLVAGWYDHNTNIDLGLLDMLRQESNPAVRDKHKILIGPWVHGGTGQAFVGSDNQGELTYPAAAFKNHAYENAFLDYYLRDIPNGWESDTAVYTYFQMGEEKWESAAQWPPIQVESYILYLMPSGILGTGNDVDDVSGYFYDPNNPSPSTGGKTLTPGLEQGPLDQRDEVESRDDGLIYTSEALAEDLQVKGTISLSLFVKSDRLDTDFMARLMEVYPDGRSMLLGEAAQRMRYRNGVTEPEIELMEPGEVYEIDLAFDELAVTIKAGNKIRIMITSSNYPRYNRNMNTGGEMYPGTNSDTLVNPLVAYNEVYEGGSYGSHLNLEVVSAPTFISEIVAQPSIQLYPNPSNGMIQIQGVEVPFQIKLIDALGNVVLECEQKTNELDVEHFSPGYYSIIISSNQSTMASSFLLE